MSVTDEIKSRLDIVDFVSDYLPLRKSGNSYSGFCPFHSNTRTPAFVVFPGSQTWRCFGACAEGGDIFSFVMKKEGWSFKEALTNLADRAGVTLAEESPLEKARQAEEDRLGGLLTAAAGYFHQLLLNAPQAEFARSYVVERGLSSETLEVFQVGYALNSWSAAREHFQMQGYSDDDLVDAGLLTVNEDKGTQYDRFRNRLMIPIRDLSGQVVGFGARTLDKDGLPKYLNSPQTTLFDKSRLLFGLDMAKRHIREARQVVIVEGYMDVMSAWQAGFRNVVAQMGTALTEMQLQLAKRYSRRFVLALDADAAGAKATLRSLAVAREALDRTPDAHFDARGLVHHEGRLQADIRIVTLPEGNDPDKIIRTDPTQWPRLLSQAKAVVAYVIDVLTADLDLSDPKAKTRVAQQILPLIADVHDPVEREHYRQLLARTLQVDERALRQVTVPARRKQAPRPSSAAPAPARPAASGLTAVFSGQIVATGLREANFLCQCLSYPQIMAQVDRKLALSEQPTVNAADFEQSEDKAIWRLIRRRSGRASVAPLENLWDSLENEGLRERVEFLMTLPKTDEADLDRLPDRLVLSVLDWRLEKAKALLNEVKRLTEQVEIQNDPEVLALYDQQRRELPLLLLSINKAKGAMSAVSRRRLEAPSPRR